MGDYNEAESSIEEMDEILNTMLSELSAEEMEQAARTSYIYFIAVTKQKECEENTTSSEEELKSLRRSKAMAMARRCLIADNGNPTVALQRMRSTLVWRTEIDIDGMRTCFLDDENDERHAEMRSALLHSTSTGKYAVRGYDKQGRALQLLTSRLNVPDDTPEGILAATIYHGERAIACTERKSSGDDDECLEKFHVALDFKDFKYEHAVSLAAAKATVFALRDHYCERVQGIYILDAPMVFQIPWKIIQPFLDPDTKTKIQFLNGEEEKKRIFDDVFDQEEAVSCILEDGHLVKPYNVHKFLYEVPFDFAYDEV